MKEEAVGSSAKAMSCQCNTWRQRACRQPAAAAVADSRFVVACRWLTNSQSKT